jgi:hypothetical protein
MYIHTQHTTNDSRICLQEYEAMADAHGKVSEERFVRAVQDKQLNLPQRDIASMFATMDVNCNGSLEVPTSDATCTLHTNFPY